MRHRYLYIPVILALAVLGDAILQRTAAGSSENSPVYTINLVKYRWALPEFRMAGKSAYLIMRIENPHEHSVEVTLNCHSPQGRIPQMSGQYTIEPFEFMYMDTRRLEDPIQKGEGVRVKCRFLATSSARVETWIYDENMKRARNIPSNSVRG